MYQRASGLTKFVILFCDLICICMDLFISDYLWHEVLGHKSRGGANYFTLALVLAGVYLVVFLFVKIYGEFYVRGKFLEAWAVVKANIFLMLGLTLVMFFIKMSTKYSRMVLGIFAVINCIVMWVARLVLKKVLPFVYKKMVAKHKAIVVGSEAFVHDIYEELWITKDYSVELVGKCITGKSDEKDIVDIANIAKGIEGLMEFCRSESVDEVIIEINTDNRDELLPIIDELASAGIVIKYRTKLPVLHSVGCQAVSRAGAYFVATYATRTVSTGNLIVKRAFDIFAGAIGSLVTIIMTIFIAPAIKLESPGPVFFSQKRVGRNGRIFTIYKFRSMYADAEERKAKLMKDNEMDGLIFKMKDDPRITKVGKFLRKTSLDEFPQFFNVLAGDMSMVGTRPPTLDEFEKYNLAQKGRLSFRPGLTGLWQVSGRNEINDFDEIVALDKEYIKTWSPVQDLKIILKTIPAMLSGR